MEEYESSDILFTITCVLGHKSVEYSEDGEKTKFRCPYSELVPDSYGRGWSCGEHFNEETTSLRKLVKELEESTAWVFEEHREIGLIAMMFNFLDHLCEELNESRGVKLLYTFAYENIKVVLKLLKNVYEEGN